MKPTPRQAFLIGFVYGCSFENDEKIEIWIREKESLEFFEAILLDHGIEKTTTMEQFRYLLVIKSFRDIEAFLQALDIDFNIFDKNSMKTSPSWLASIEDNDFDFAMAFILGMFESSGKLKINNYVPDIDFFVTNLSLDLIKNIDNIVQLLWKRIKDSSDERDAFYFESYKEISGVKYTKFKILPLVFKEMLLGCSVAKYSKAHIVT